MTSDRAKSISVLAVYACILAILIGFSLSPLWAQSPPAASTPALLSRAEIQAALDKVGYCRIPAGTHTLDGAIIIRAGCTLEGAGFASRLSLDKGDTALIFGESPETAEPYIYGAYVRDVQFIGGGVRINKLAQHCGIDRVWVSAARVDAFRIDGLGERLTLRDCVAWQAARHGFAIRATRTNNGIALDHCNAQGCGGAGVLLETAVANAQLNQTLIAGCVIQGNQRLGAAPADLWIRGYVGETTLRDSWIESPGKLGLLAEPITWEVSASPPATVTRRVGFLSIEGATVISQCTTAATLIDANDARIERLSVSPASAQVLWKLRAPGGAQLMLKPGQLAQYGSLPAASQPGVFMPNRLP